MDTYPDQSLQAVENCVSSAVYNFSLKMERLVQKFLTSPSFCDYG